jgi:hypothetical protein
MNAMQGKKFCCDRCRMDGYVLRRAKAMLDEVGIVELNAILQKTVRRYAEDIKRSTAFFELIRRWKISG